MRVSNKPSPMLNNINSVRTIKIGPNKRHKHLICIGFMDKVNCMVKDTGKWGKWGKLGEINCVSVSFMVFIIVCYFNSTDRTDYVACNAL